MGAEVTDDTLPTGFTLDAPPAASQAPGSITLPQQPASEALPAGFTLDTPPATSWRGVARNVGAGLLDAAGNVINVISDPVGNLALQPLAVVGGTVYDAGARLFGYPPMTPEQRASLYGQTDLDKQPGTRLMETIGGPGMTAPASPTEHVVRTAAGGAATLAELGPGGLLPAIAGGVGALTGDIASQYVPDWLKPFAGLAGNVAGTAGVGGAASAFRTPAGLVDPGKAALGDLALSKYDIPIDATDLTKDPRFTTTPADVAAKQNAWQGSVIDEMGGDGNKFTPQLMTDTATRTGKVYDDIAGRTTVGQAQTDNLVHNDLAAIEANLDNVAGITDSDRGVVRRRLGEIVDAVQPNGTISGADYRSLTQTGSPLDRLENNSNPELAQIGGSISDALRKAFNQSATPEDQAALTKNDYQYRIMKTVQDLAAKSPDGNIDPGQFMTKVAAASRRFDAPNSGIAYTGGGNIGELARIGAMMNTTPTFGPRPSLLATAARIAGEAAPGLTAAGVMHSPHALALTLPAAYDLGASLRNALLTNRAPSALISNALSPPASPYSAVLPSVVAGNRNQPPQQP